MSNNGFLDSGVKCGKCQQYHKNAAEVKVCFMEAKAAQEATAQTKPATEKQVGFLLRLAGERPMWANVENLHDDTIRGFATAPDGKATASYWIGEALKVPKEALPAAQQAVQAELEDGIYRTADGTIYKVYHTVHGANQQAAKKLNITEAGTDPETGKPLYNGSFEYLGKKPLYSLTAGDMLSQEEAMQFGLVYSFCCNCTRDLTREESIYVGYGPTCAKNLGWWYPTKVELKALKAGTVTPEGLQAVQEQVKEEEANSLAEACAEPF